MSLLGTNVINTLGSFAGNVLTGSQSSGGSVSNAGGSNYGYNTAQSINRAQSSGYSQTKGTEASSRAANAAAVANKIQKDYMNDVMRYNAEQAQIQREWEERMANTIYTRSVANMKEAGINPVLAASMGLSGASVGSGATASISMPSAYMGQTFADQNSANQAWSTGDSYSHGEQSGSWGSSSTSWNNSESGLATGLKQMADFTSDLASTVNAAKAIDWLKDKLESDVDAMKETAKNDPNNTAIEQGYAGNDKLIQYYIEKFKGFLSDNGLGSLLMQLPFGSSGGYNRDTISEIAKKWGKSEEETRRIIEKFMG